MNIWILPASEVKSELRVSILGRMAAAFIILYIPLEIVAADYDANKPLKQNGTVLEKSLPSKAHKYRPTHKTKSYAGATKKDYSGKYENVVTPKTGSTETSKHQAGKPARQNLTAVERIRERYDIPKDISDAAIRDFGQAVLALGGKLNNDDWRFFAKGDGDKVLGALVRDAFEIPAEVSLGSAQEIKEALEFDKHASLLGGKLSNDDWRSFAKGDGDKVLGALVRDAFGIPDDVGKKLSVKELINASRAATSLGIEGSALTNDFINDYQQVENGKMDTNDFLNRYTDLGNENDSTEQSGIGSGSNTDQGSDASTNSENGTEGNGAGLPIDNTEAEDNDGTRDITPDSEVVDIDIGSSQADSDHNGLGEGGTNSLGNTNTHDHDDSDDSGIELVINESGDGQFSTTAVGSAFVEYTDDGGFTVTVNGSEYHFDDAGDGQYVCYGKEGDFIAAVDGKPDPGVQETTINNETGEITIGDTSGLSASNDLEDSEGSDSSNDSTDSRDAGNSGNPGGVDDSDDSGDSDSSDNSDNSDNSDSSNGSDSSDNSDNSDDSGDSDTSNGSDSSSDSGDSEDAGDASDASDGDSGMPNPMEDEQGGGPTDPEAWQRTHDEKVVFGQPDPDGSAPVDADTLELIDPAMLYRRGEDEVIHTTGEDETESDPLVNEIIDEIGDDAESLQPSDSRSGIELPSNEEEDAPLDDNLLPGHSGHSGDNPNDDGDPRADDD